MSTPIVYTYSPFADTAGGRNNKEVGTLLSFAAVLLDIVVLSFLSAATTLSTIIVVHITQYNSTV